MRSTRWGYADNQHYDDAGQNETCPAEQDKGAERSVRMQPVATSVFMKHLHPRVRAEEHPDNNVALAGTKLVTQHRFGLGTPFRAHFPFSHFPNAQL